MPNCYADDGCSNVRPLPETEEMISLVDLVAATLSVTAGAAWLNARWLRLPNSVGLLLLAILISFCLLFLQFALPYWEPQKQAIEAIRQINFPQTLINGMLAYLLFAGALHLDISKLRERRLTVIAMATVGVVISTAVVATGIWIASGLLGVPIPFKSALVFGALISPTDPVAVLSTLKKVVVPATLETEITGESLFNDGIGIVLYVVLLSFALGGPESKLDLGELGTLFLVEVFGGAVSGLAFGFIAYRAMRGIDDYVVEVLISLATATASFAVARSIGASGPIAVVCAGIILGDRGAAFAMSESTRRYLFGFWDLVSELLNSVLFLLIGLEVLVLRLNSFTLPTALAAIPIVFFARLCAVAIPVAALQKVSNFIPGTIPVLTCAGIRGGISVALALALPPIEGRDTLVGATYLVVVFTMVVQGLTLPAVVRRSTA